MHLSGGEGLGALCEGLAMGAPALVILNLSATGLTSDHVPALRALSHVSLERGRWGAVDRG